MNRIYFTALHPASDLEMKLKKIRQEASINSPLPPIIPLKIHTDIIHKNDINFNIDSIDEFKTSGLEINGDWLIENIPLDPLKRLIDSPYSFLDLNKPGLIIGRTNVLPQLSLKQSIIRNWDLVFYELISWDEKGILNNIELIEHWKIKKKKLK